MGENIQEKYNKFYKNNDWKNLSFITKQKILVFFKILKTVTKANFKTIIDAGCGTGIYTYLLNHIGYKAVGFDFSYTAISLAKKKYEDLDFRDLNGFALDYTQKFDLIFANGFSPFNTTNFKNSTRLIDYWSGFLNEKGKILIITRTNFSQKSPSGWLFLSEEQLANLYYKDEMNKNTIYLYSKFWIIISLLPKSKTIIDIVSYVSKNIVAKFLKIPVSVLIILSKR